MKHPHHNQPLPEDPDAPPSKSQIKRELHQLQELGRELVELPASRLSRLNLSDGLREAVELGRRIHAHGGRKRQIMFIGKLLRDEDAVAIRTQMEQLAKPDRQATEHLHRLEALRDQLLEDDNALTELLTRHPQADRQQLRQLIRQARNEKSQDSSPRAYRALFRFLKELSD